MYKFNDKKYVCKNTGSSKKHIIPKNINKKATTKNMRIILQKYAIRKDYIVIGSYITEM